MVMAPAKKALLGADMHVGAVRRGADIRHNPAHPARTLKLLRLLHRTPTEVSGWDIPHTLP